LFLALSGESPRYCCIVSYTLGEINALNATDFVRVAGPVFEHSPWVAERVASAGPFQSVDSLHRAMCEAVRTATVDKQLALIRAHPDLVGRAVVTAESQGEQAAAGLTSLSPAEVGLFEHFNREYKQRFGFPFVICARLNKKEAILDAFPVRLQNSAEKERETALAEIYKIARLRLADLISEE
jgi:OHCU decarboxylase